MNFRYSIIIAGLISVLLLPMGCKKRSTTDVKDAPNQTNEISVSPLAPQKILYIDSYHKDYTAGIAAREAFEKGMEKVPREVRFEFMDAKRKKAPELQKKEALRIKAIIDQWQPDLIVAADDSANKYLIAPFFKDSEIPVIFNGVNWDASAYGYPAENVTGQIEVELIVELIDQLKKHAKGTRVGLLTGETLTDRKSLKLYSEILNLEFDKASFVNDFDEWKKEYIQMQEAVDIVILRNNTGIKNWDDNLAQNFIINNSSIPSGAVSTHLKELALVCFPKLNQEFGEITADIAQDILVAKKSPGDIPLRKNIKSNIYLNMPLAQKLGVIFPFSLIANAQLIEGELPKVLFVNSYHEGYEWSDRIEKGVRAFFEVNKVKVDLKFFRMNTKIERTEEAIKLSALRAKELIESWEPDVVIAADDNASKYLVEPYYKGSDIPFVFCGLNWDASIYGFPTENVTGIVEIATIDEAINLMRGFTSGKRIGFIAVNTLSENKSVANYKKQLGIEFDEVAFVDTYDQWEKNYRKLQSSVDMLVWTSHVGIDGWEREKALKFIDKYTSIPSASIIEHSADYVVFTRAKVAKEQGWKAASYVNDILKGKAVSELPVIHNENYKQIINMKLANKLKLRLPIELLNESTIITDD